MPVPPKWFYHAAEPRIAGYVGPDAAALWVSSRFWFLVAWVLAAPVGLSCLLLAETPRAPSALWVAAGACWIGALPFGTRSLVNAGAATRSASAFLSETRGYRMEVSLPITPLASQWIRAVRRADAQHEAHVQLAQTAGITAAIDQLVERRRAERRLWWVALAVVGFLLGFVVGVLGAFAVGQTQSLGVFLVFVFATGCACALPYLLRPRFEGAFGSAKWRYGIRHGVEAPRSKGQSCPLTTLLIQPCKLNAASRSVVISGPPNWSAESPTFAVSTGWSGTPTRTPTALTAGTVKRHTKSRSTGPPNTQRPPVAPENAPTAPSKTAGGKPSSGFNSRARYLAK
jgi:hypothetical protein